MKLFRLIATLTIAGSALLVPAAHGLAAPKTTTPDVSLDIDVTITDSRIVLTDNTAERGDGVNFHVRNVGKRVHSFALLADSAQLIALDRAGLHTPLLKPKQTSILQVYMDSRGTFVYRSLASADRAKPGMHGKFVVN